MTGFDLDAYLDRIGFEGEVRADMATLRAICARHADAIAFENIDPRLDRPVALDIESLQRKLVRGGRGGFCYEHNTLLTHALTRIGFEVTGLAARVLWKDPTKANRPRSHMLLKIPVDGVDHVADVGFGGLTLTGPLELVNGEEQETPHEPFQIVHDRGSYTMEARLSTGWRPLYRFDLQEQLPADYEVASWYLTHHPASHFRATLMAARAAPDRRYALSDNRLTVRFLDGQSETRMLETGASLRASLEDDFRLDLSEIDGIDARLDEIVTGRREAAA